MPVSALRPRSVTEIADASFQILRAHFGPLVLCSAIAYVPVLLARIFLIGDPAQYESIDAVQGTELLVRSFQSSLVAVLGYALMAAVLTVCASQAYLGDEVDVGAAVRRVASRLPGVLLSVILVTALLVIGLMLLLFPALWVTARYFAVTPALLLEDRGVFSAMSRSVELSKGRKWHILNALGLVLLIYFLIFFGVSIVGAMTGSFIVQILLAAIVTICLYPVVAIAGVLLYYDARVQSEGLDIEMMTDALGSSTATAAS